MSRKEVSIKITTAVFLGILVYITPLVGESLVSALEFHREHIKSGEYHRALLAHYMHFGWYHTIFNGLGLFGLGYLLLWCAPLVYWFYVLILCPLLISACMYFMNPELSMYRGFSGAFYSLLVFGAYHQLKINWRGSAVLTALVVVKIGMEQMPSYDVNYLKEHIGVAVMVDAHLYGALMGCIVLALHLAASRCLPLARSRD